jgi:hypothetical protein
LIILIILGEEYKSRSSSLSPVYQSKWRYIAEDSFEGTKSQGNPDFVQNLEAPEGQRNHPVGI